MFRGGSRWSGGFLVEMVVGVLGVGGRSLEDVGIFGVFLVMGDSRVVLGDLGSEGSSGFGDSGEFLVVV